MREDIINILKVFVEEKYPNILQINSIAEIPVDSKVDEGIGVLYVRKISTAYNDIFNFYNPREMYKIGLRTSYPHTTLHVVKGEEIIRELQRYLYLNNNICGVLTELTNDYSIVDKDNLQRYFFEFQIKVKKY